MKKIFYPFTGLMSLALISCNGETVDYSEPKQPDPVVPSEIPEVRPPSMASAPLSSVPSEAIRNLNDFSLRFYLENSKKIHGNVCVSPLSVGSVLGMMANGDTGDARNEVLKALGFDESDEGLNELNLCYQTLLSNLPNIEEDISCNVTNTLWCDLSRYSLYKPFSQAISDYYYATNVGISPRGESGKDAINAFVSKNTNGLIKNFITSPLEISLAFLNTIYFKAGWSECFVEDLTSKDSFYDIDYREKKTDFMMSNIYMGYSRSDDGTEAVRMNYGERRQFSMTMILPTTLINHVAIDEVLTPENMEQLNANMKGESILLRMPKFEIEMNDANTIETLRKLGLEKLCGDYPTPFKDIAEGVLFHLKCFIHATKLKVDENGTEGAAASLGGLVDSAGPGNENGFHEIVFNRPFIFYIQENTTGAIIFIGSVKTFS